MYKFLLAIRYLLRRRITLLAVMAVTLCVFMVVVVMTVMIGLVDDFTSKNHEFFSDCIISTDSLVGFAYYEEFITQLDEQDFVAAAAPVLKSVAMLTVPSSDKNWIIEVMGIDVARHIKATNFGKTIHYHSKDPQNVFTPSYDPEKPGCVVGIEKLKLERISRTGEYYHPSSPMEMQMEINCFPLTAGGGLAKKGMDIVNSSTFYYSDDCHSGIVRLDEDMVYLPLDTVQKLCVEGNEKRVTAIFIKFTDGQDLDSATNKVKVLWADFVASKEGDRYAGLLEAVNVQRWYDYRRNTIAPMQKEQTMMALLFVMLGIITVFIILVVFYMIISHKSKDIGILKSIGVSPADIIQIFLMFAGMIGVIGSAIGTVAGCAVLINANVIEDWVFEKFGREVWDRNIYAIGEIPNNIEINVIVTIVVSAIFACLIGALIPGIQAARRRPAEILQVDQL